MPRTNINQLVENKLEADNKFNEVIFERIERLSKVASNVLKKSGYNRRALSEDEIKSCFPEETHWVFDWNFARKSRPAVRTGTRRTAGYNSNNGAHIISVDSNNIHCILYVNGEVENFVIPVRVLKFSDRDFAKLIREGVKALRRKDAYHEHVRREKHIRDMKDALAEMQDAIAKKEKESVRYNEQREAYIEESNARTRERHAELKAEREQERLEQSA